MIGKYNIFNIRYNSHIKWKGQTGSFRGFCNFESVDYAVRACAIMLLQSYRQRGCFTVRSIITRFAPPFENDTEKYISFVCGFCHFSDDNDLNYIDLYYPLIVAIAKYETGTNITESFVETIIQDYNIKLWN